VAGRGPVNARKRKLWETSLEPTQQLPGTRAAKRRALDDVGQLITHLTHEREARKACEREEQLKQRR